jgi:hypothetical protein
MITGITKDYMDLAKSFEQPWLPQTTTMTGDS